MQEPSSHNPLIGSEGPYLQRVAPLNAAPFDIFNSGRIVSHGPPARRRRVEMGYEMVDEAAEEGTVCDSVPNEGPVRQKLWSVAGEYH